MFDFLKKIVSVICFTFLTVSTASAAGFSNPTLKSAGGCDAANNLRAERFAADVNESERREICRAIEKITYKLNSTVWSLSLAAELGGIWQTFSNEAVALRMMPRGTSSRVLAMAQPFPADANVGANKFAAAVFLRPEKSDDDSFFQVLMHELRHVFDFYNTWRARTSLDSIEIERRAFLLMSKISEETPERESFSSVPKFWKESWRKRSAQEIAQKRESAISKYLRGNKIYRELAQNAERRTLDFSYLNASAKTNDWQFANAVGNAGNYSKKDGERLPERPLVPVINSVLPQNVKDAKFNLERPKNSTDPKEILRVAVANEKKLFYGMTNFVYDQKLAFQCFQKGKVAASLTENDTVARGENGNAYLRIVNAPQQQNSSSAASLCALDSENLKTDFTETFWASPALDRMPITFVGFVTVEGKRVARYSVLQPDAKTFKQLAAEYANIKPFRVFVGTIFVSPEDGQIVRFWGTSYPEEAVTGAGEQKIWGSYSVTAVRQKLDIDGGVWMTVHVGTSAIANIAHNPRPFSYTVRFENYRQGTSEVKILDEETVAATGNLSATRAGEFK